MTEETNSLPSVMERLERVEKQNSRFRSLLTVSILLAILALLLPCFSLAVCHFLKVPRILEAQGIILRDEKGRERVVMSAGMIGLRDPLDNAGIVFFDSTGLPGVTIGASSEGGSISIQSWEMKPKVHISADVGITPSVLIMGGGVGLPKVSMMRTKEGELRLWAFEHEKHSTLTLSTSATSLVLADKDGKITWSAP